MVLVGQRNSGVQIRVVYKIHLKTLNVLQSYREEKDDVTTAGPGQSSETSRKAKKTQRSWKMEDL